MSNHGARLTALTLLLGTMGLLAGCVFVDANLGAMTGPMTERRIVPAKRWWTTDKIALIDISGPITLGDGGFASPLDDTVSALRRSLDLALADRGVAAIIVRIDSPGGGVTASDVCYRELTRFRERAARERGKPVPVIAAMMDTAASGGYYLALAADEIWALPTSVTGSIGVVATLPQLSGLADKLGVGVRVIKSGDMKDLGSMWREMTDEERKVYQGLIDAFYARFVGLLVERRKGMDQPTAERLADGRVYTAQQALDNGLIDMIGYLDQVVDAARERAGLKDAIVVTYARRGPEREGFYSRAEAAPRSSALAPAGGAEINLLKIGDAALGRADSARFHYLWLP